MPNPAALLALFALRTDSPITLAAPAQPLSRLIPAIARQTGATIEVGPSLADEVVCLKVDKVPLEQLLSKIAYVVDAEWVKTETGRRLTRPPGAAADRRRREEAVLAESMRRAQAKLAATLKDQPNWSPEEADKLAHDASKLMRAYDPNSSDQAFYKRQQALESRSPLTRFLNHILLGLDARDLAKIRPHHRYVWSSDPTAMEYALPAKALASAQNLARDYGYWLSSAKKFGVGNIERNGMTYSLGGMFELNDAERKGGPVTRMLLIGQMYNWQSGIHFELQVADSSGKIVGTARQSLMDTVWNALSEPVKESKDAISPPAEVKALIDSLNGGPDSKGHTTLPADLLARLKTPTSNDPLSLFVSPILFTIADRQKENLVASLSDGMTTFLFTTMNPMPLASIRELTSGLMHQEWQEADGWFTLRSNTPIWDRESAASRKALQLMVDQTLSKRRLSLDEKARLASMLPMQMDNSLPMFLKQLVMATQESMTIGGDEDALRFYGLLDSATFSRMQTPSGILVRNLPNAVVEKIHQMTYHSDPWSIQLSWDDSQNADPSLFEKFYNGLMKEPAESMPNGIPGSATIKATITSETVAKPIKKAAESQFVYVDENGMDANTLAWELFEASRPDLFPESTKQNQGIDYTKFRVATRRTVNFVIRLTPVLQKTITLYDVDFPEDKIVSYNELPDDFRKKVDAAMAEQKKGYADGRPGEITRPARSNGQPR